MRVSRAKIETCDLTHHYGCDRGWLDRINLTNKPWEKVGLVWRSEVGKSTFLKLLLRFYDVESGKIVIGGKISAMSPKTAWAAKLEWCNKTAACCTVWCVTISDIVVKIPVMMQSWMPQNKSQDMTLLSV